MRIPCPLCGARDRREFYYKGAALARPAPDADAQAWDEYVHLRENPAGQTRDLWHHEAGCGAWLVVTRDTVTHEVLDVVLAREAGL
jgi:sarcosine oxidase subunit delta